MVVGKSKTVVEAVTLRARPTVVRASGRACKVTAPRRSPRSRPRWTGGASRWHVRDFGQLRAPQRAQLRSAVRGPHRAASATAARTAGSTRSTTSRAASARRTPPAPPSARRRPRAVVLLRARRGDAQLPALAARHRATRPPARRAARCACASRDTTTSAHATPVAGATRRARPGERGHRRDRACVAGAARGAARTPWSRRRRARSRPFRVTGEGGLMRAFASRALLVARARWRWPRAASAPGGSQDGSATLTVTRDFGAQRLLAGARGPDPRRRDRDALPDAQGQGRRDALRRALRERDRGRALADRAAARGATGSTS